MTVPLPSLACRQLRLRDFRNFADVELEFPAEGIALIGENGSGKTNLLEAIYYLEIFRSLRGSSDEQLVRFGAEVFHLRGRFENAATEERLEVMAAYEPKGRTKRVTVDGVVPERLGDAVGRVRAVVFSPTDMSIVAGPPSERRRFLDIVLSVNAPGHLAVLQRYRHVLRQRNALLRTGGSTDALVAWDTALVEAGARIITERARWVTAWSPEFERRACRVSGGAGPRIRYSAGVPLEAAALASPQGDGADHHDPVAPDGDLEGIHEAFARELERVRLRERERGVTLAGPHRDDLAIVVDTPEGEVDLRDFGSAGQMRTAAIALRMVEAETAKAGGLAPILLLDDVFAELDAGRTRRILELLEEEGHGQVVLTAPKESDLDVGSSDDFVSALPRWRIAAGRIAAG